jgi:tetratricopeptide (TPR) repeat protein
VKHRTMLAALSCAAAVLAGPARAAEESSAKGSATLEEARQHAAKAKVHYDLGEFEKAAEEYILVYRLRPLPALLFNIAQSYRQGGQYEKARQFYKAYLREANDSKNKSAIEKAIREIDELLAKEKRAREVPPKGVAQTPPVSGGAAASAATAAPPLIAPQASAAPAQGSERVAVADPAKSSGAVPAVAGPAAQAAPAPLRPPVPIEAVSSSVQPSRGRSRTYAYISAGAAAVFIGAGLAFASKASKFEDELNARPHPQATIDDLSSSAKSSKTLAAICMGAGVVAAVGAGLFYFLPTGDGVAVQGRF